MTIDPVTIFRGIVVACWAVHEIYWIVASRSTKRTIERDPRSLWVLVLSSVVVGLGLMGVRMAIFGQRGLPLSVLSSAAGSLTCLVGVAVTLWARRALGTNWSGPVTLKQNHELIQSGPYRLVRHPIYFGLLLMMVGTILAFGWADGLVVLPVMAFGFWMKARREEAMMLKHFPEAYAGYRAHVKGLVPFVW